MTEFMEPTLDQLQETENRAWRRHKTACELAEETKIEWTAAYKAVVQAKAQMKQTEPQKH